VGRTRAGTSVNQEIAYPFVGEVGRWAGRQSFRRDDQFFDYMAGDDPSLSAPHVLLPMREQAFDLTAIRRIGRRGNTALLGVALGYQETELTRASSRWRRRATSTTASRRPTRWRCPCARSVRS
jgi:hypothetical protein